LAVLIGPIREAIQAEQMERKMPPRYRAFVLRAWQVQPETPGARAIWRYSAQDPSTAEWHHFVGLDEMIVFLRAELDDEGSNQIPRREE
jgi:hypothetical protein